MEKPYFESVLRLSTPDGAKNYLNTLIKADEGRSKVRARVKGQVDGNLPYNPRKLQQEGQSFRSNFNSREGEAFFALALSAFYDIFSEAPTYATVITDVGGPDKSVEYSRIITEEFDVLQKGDEEFDYLIQLSQHEMTLYGTGPVFFDDPLDWTCRPLNSACLLVPDSSKSNVSTWEVCAIRDTYTVGKLYGYIKDEGIAKKVGWDVEAVKNSITKALPEDEVKGPDGGNWEFIQQQIRNNELLYSSKCPVIKIAHIFTRERNGKISHTIIDETHSQKFLFVKTDKYERWSEVIHPMYYDKGDGKHHSVKGLGVKMFAILELKNRLKNSAMDAAFIDTQLMVESATEGGFTGASVINHGAFCALPPGVTLVQRNYTGRLESAVQMDRELDNLMTGNLSQYRQRIDKPNGNPRTATEIEAIMAQQSTLGKTQISRYYQQLDGLFAERYRRATAILSGEGSSKSIEAAVAFKKKCADRGVPMEALEKAKVKATRVAGQGNTFLRSQTLGELLQLSSALPEAGRENLIQDYIASKVGQQMVKRYYPGASTPTEQDQAAMATMEHAAIKEGISPLVTGTQNNLIHAQIHMQAGTEAVYAIENNPGASDQVAAFLQGLVHHLGQHMQVLANDKLRQNEFKQMLPQFKEFVKLANEAVGHASEQASSQQQAQSQQPQMSQEEMMKMQAFQLEQQRKDAALKSDIQRKDIKNQQHMAIVDAKAAAQIAAQANQQNGGQ